jgi:hypothetical protein
MYEVLNCKVRELSLLAEVTHQNGAGGVEVKIASFFVELEVIILQSFFITI